jgi:cytochrome P450
MQAISGRVEAIIEGLIGKMRGREEIDLVDGFSYPLPVTVICELLGIPPSDEPKVQGWTRTFARVLDPDRRRGSSQERRGFRGGHLICKRSRQGEAQAASRRRFVGPRDLQGQKTWTDGQI